MLKRVFYSLIFILLFINAHSRPLKGLTDISSDLFRIYTSENKDISASLDSMKIRFKGDVLIRQIEEYSSISGEAAPKGDKFFDYYKNGEYDSIINLEPQNVFHHYIKTISFFRLSMTDSAISSAEEMLKHDSGANRGEIRTMLACFLMNKGLEDSAYSIVFDSDNDHAKLLKGIYFYNKGLLDSSLAYLIPLRTKELEPVSYQMLADIFTKKNDYEQALYFIKAFEKEYADRDPDYYMTYLKAEIHYRKGYFKRSIIYFQDAAYGTVNQQIRGNAYYWIGKSYFMLGDYENMEKYLSSLVKGGMESDYKKNAFFLDGKGFYLKGDYGKAVKKLISFIDEYPHDNLTPYALEMITEGYFRMGRYVKSAEYLSRIKKPDFIVEKTKRIKYFLDYKSGLYNDSIDAYNDFLNKEPTNPFRREVFQFIIENTADDSLRSVEIERFADEFPESDKLREYVAKYCDLITDWEGEELAVFISNILRGGSKNSSAAAVDLIGLLFEKKKYTKIVYLYSNLEGNELADNPKIIYCAAVSLARLKNIEGARVLLDGLTETQGIYADSAAYALIEIGYNSNDLAMLDDISLNKRVIENNAINALLKLKMGILLRNAGRAEESVSLLEQSAELFEDDRNSMALSLLEASVSAYINNDAELSGMLLEKALLMATDIDVINRIRMEDERRKKD